MEPVYIVANFGGPIEDAWSTPEAAIEHAVKLTKRYPGQKYNVVVRIPNEVWSSERHHQFREELHTLYKRSELNSERD